MNTLIKTVAAVSLVAASASASAWWSGPGSYGNNGFGDMFGMGDTFGDMFGDGNFNMNMNSSANTRAWGRGYGRGYERVSGYGYGAPYYGYGAPYGYAPHAATPYAAPVAPQAPAAPQMPSAQ
jgi:hypothetical protein